MRTRSLALLFVALSVLPAVAGPKEDLIAADKAFSDYCVAKGSNVAFLAYLADDGRLFGIGNRSPIYGKAEATKRFTDPSESNGDPATNVLSWTPDHADVSADGTVGWTDGAWHFIGAPDAAGKRPEVTGHYLTVWKKDSAGQWKVEADMGTINPHGQ